ncbi:KAP family P-loop NTPase fold protein [Engelhardtia mirabilis]|uniref:KAP family P-loop domain protein n=1 Tax=Engelhardtia mirabilis TaxID=2528011 RepID=A0A518BE81_9BACT|nr:KAP family P-loop domain protein [Planctomycetes bacterium Pla133]QDU99620.1 KAP family P-loop domain protein [Planctomycetes bacterium Pla86]
MWSDVETDQDYLNYTEVAELAANLIRQRTLLPISIGIFGGWGSGKSSLLKLVHKELNEREGDRYLHVEFDAWLYQGFDDARAALMEAISARLVEAVEEGSPLGEKVKRFAKRVNYFRVLGLGMDVAATAMGAPTLGAFTAGGAALGRMFSGDGTGEDVGQIKETGKAAKDIASGLVKPGEPVTPPKQIAAFREELSEILENLDKVLVVSIDNLDRCLPTNAIHTLEAVRLFLFVDRTAFIVAADEDMIRFAVTEHYGRLGERHVKDYLDKFIQVPIRVPRLGVAEVRAYMMLLFSSLAVGRDVHEGIRANLQVALRESWSTDEFSSDRYLEGVAGEPRAKLELGFGIATRMARLLARSSHVGGNPRTVKRMLNVVQMRSEIAQRRKMPVDAALIAKVALFERCTDSAATAALYGLINSADAGAPPILMDLEGEEDEEALVKMCADSFGEQHAPFIRDWVRLEPALGGADLRPLVYLSRETLPLASADGALSPAAEKVVRTLLLVKSKNSPGAKGALKALGDEEKAQAMATLTAQLRRTSDWSSAPDGFKGLLILAEETPECGRMARQFIESLQFGKLPGWMNVLVKNQDWYTAE